VVWILATHNCPPSCITPIYECVALLGWILGNLEPAVAPSHHVIHWMTQGLCQWVWPSLLIPEH
jgi:hypothetical protein